MTPMTEYDALKIKVEILGPVLTLIAVIVGIWQFNKGQRDLKEKEIQQRKAELEKMNNQASIEVLAKFKELQSKLYIETTSVLSYLTINDNFNSPEYKAKIEKFWQLHWVELASVESEEVADFMYIFGDVLQEIQDTNFVDFKEKQQRLRAVGHEVALKIKESSKMWELPDGLKNQI